VIWAKTDAGRAEMQARALIKERALRNLLLLIDGNKTEEMLLANLAGIDPSHFTQLESMGLIEPAAAPAARTAAARAAAGAAPAPKPEDPAPAAPLDYAHFTQTLTQLISKELGLRGFTLTLAVEKASSIEELRDVANRALDQIRDRKGPPAAELARRSLFGA
jgi:hypothetical protein